jgi:iron(III) transport system substrate-binding protein
MSERAIQIVVVLLLALVLGVPFLLRPHVEGSGAKPGDRLIIYSPHNEQIRYEFSRAFNAKRASEGKPPIDFDWRSSGGASDLRKEVSSQFTGLAKKGKEDQGIGADLFFGGGDFEHNQIAAGVTVDGGDGKPRTVQIAEPVGLSPEFLKEVYPESAIAGVPLYHPKQLWVGVVLSSFGIIYNNDYLKMINQPVPRTWSDLADPAYSQAVALADPGHSGSIAVTYHTIIQQYGWVEGWASFRRIAANARYFTASASKVPVDVSSGEAAAGMCIDFYGRFQVGAIGEGRLGYIDPPKVTAITPDPITILRGAPHLELAREFCAWLLTKEGQRLWVAKTGVPGGPDKYELRRFPVRQDMYTSAEMSLWTDQEKPFEIAAPVLPGTPSYFRMITPISHAMAIDIHEDLRAAWASLSRAKTQNHPKYQEMLALFDSMPSDLMISWPTPDCARDWKAILADKKDPRNDALVKALAGFTKKLGDRYRQDPEALVSDRLKWTLFFRGNYREVVRLGRE